MRVCLDVSAAVHRRAGLGRYAQELAAALMEEEQRQDIPAITYAAFYHQRGQAHIARPLEGLPHLTTRLSVKPWRLTTMLAYFAGISMDHLFPQVDAFHATEHLLPKLKHISAVFTLHDLIFRFDPGSHKLLNRIYLNLMAPRFLQAAAAIIAVSQCTRRDAMRLYNTPGEKIHVIYEGVDARFKPVEGPEILEAVRRKYALPPRFIVYVGTIEPRKNLPALFEAFAGLREQPDGQAGEGAKLVIVGKPGWLTEETFERAKILGDDVLFTGYVADQDLPAVYSLAQAAVLPSVYEGFGLPVLEAMACGTPVACSNISSLPEVAGQAALLFDPHDPGSIRAALARLLTDTALRAERRAQGIKQAARFTWAEAARQTRQVYLDIMDRKT